MSLASNETNDDLHADPNEDFDGVTLDAAQPYHNMQSPTKDSEGHLLIDHDMATDNIKSANSTIAAAPTIIDLLSDDSELSDSIQTSASTPVKVEVIQSDFISTVRNMCTYMAYSSAQQDAHYSDEASLEEMESYKNAPIFSSEAGALAERRIFRASHGVSPFTQYGLIGVRSAASLPLKHDSAPVAGSTDPADNLLLANMNVPWSAFICGSQGAGKSHTLSCLLENALVVNSQVNRLPNPLAAMVFHYDSYTNASASQVCEAAYLCSSGIPVTVLVSPSNIWTMSELYTNLPGLPSGSPRPRVLPMYLSEDLLDITTMLKLMAIDPSADSIPFYMETVMSILREMAMEGKGAGAFSYAEFRHRVADVKWDRGQIGPLNMRLQLLDSFLQPTQFTRTTRPAPATENIWKFQPGSLTIVDLSDPFVSSTDACALFSICLSLFLADRAQCGRMVALDEAHKFLTQSSAAQALTSDLTSVIRQQRHTGTRVLIATQEPTLSPDLIDLCNATFVHRFMSPAWYAVLRQHLAGANKHDSVKDNSSLFETIVALQTGEALLFCPTALNSVVTMPSGDEKVEKLGSGYLKVKIRKRLTADGGRSILASQTADPHTPASVNQILMHVVNKPKWRPISNQGKVKDSGYSSPASVSFHPMQTRSATKTTAASQSESTTTAFLSSRQSTPAAAPSPKNQTPRWQDRVGSQTRSIVRRDYVKKKWRSKKDIHMGDLIAQVAKALDIEANLFTFPLHKTSLERLKNCAFDEMAKCNREASQS